MNRQNWRIVAMAVLLACWVSPGAVYGRVIESIELDRTPAEQALLYWGRTVNRSVIINWDRMEEEGGYDRSYPVTLNLQEVQPNRALQLIMAEVFSDGRVIAEVTPSYVRILTKDQANRDGVTRVYPVHDLLMDTGRRTAPPEFDLGNVTSDSGDGASTGSIFEDSNDDDGDRSSRADRVEALMDLIRNTIEPDIWAANGGEHGRITFFDGNLVIRAPLYVHRRLGLTEPPAPRRATRPAAGHLPSGSRAGYTPRHRTQTTPTRSNSVFTRTGRTSDGVSGVHIGTNRYGR